MSPPVYASGDLLHGRFKILRRIGEGGMGVVYEALDQERDTTVALKTITHPDPTAIFRFKREFRALADIAHPNLVPLYELVSDGEHWFFTMQLVEGTDLSRYLRPPAPQALDATDTDVSTDVDAGSNERRIAVLEAVTREGERGVKDASAPSAPASSPANLLVDWSSVDWRKVRDVFGQLASGVHALHMANRLHRDLKPSNVLVRPDGTVVILDFGLVAELERSDDVVLERTHNTPRLFATAPATDEVVSGTIQFMAPEQVTGEPLTVACDWYAVGVMLYQVSTGRLPHEGAPSKILASKVSTVPLAPRVLNPAMPEDLERLCVALLQTAPATRPSGPEIIERFRGTRSSVTPSAASPGDELPFVGRSRELDALAAAWERVERGGSALCVVRGPSGYGKTALVEQFLRTRVAPTSAMVVKARCYEHESVPYKTVDGVIDALVRVLLSLPAAEAEDALPDDVAALATLFPVLARSSLVLKAMRRRPATASPERCREQALAALRGLVARLGEKRPCIIVVDDLQWGDVDGTQALAELWAAPAPRALVVVLHRTEFEGESAAVRELAQRLPEDPAQRVAIELGALRPDETHALVRELLAREPHVGPDELWVQRITDWCAGSPWLAHALVETHGARVALEGPESLDAVVAARAASLPAPQRALLEVTSLLVRPAPLSVAFDAAYGHAGAPETVTALCQARLTKTSGPGLDDVIESFHDRVREGVVRAMSPEARRATHERIAEALERANVVDAEALAFHWEGAGRGEMAARNWLAAARSARRVLAFDRADRSLNRALALASDPDTRASAFELVIAMRTDEGRNEEAYEHARAALLELGCELPPVASAAVIAREVATLTARLGARAPAAIAQLPEASDQTARRALRLLARAMRPAFRVRAELGGLVSARAVNITLERGPTSDSALAFAVYGGVFLGGALDLRALALRWTDAALALLERLPDDERRAEVLFVAGYFGSAGARPAGALDTLLERSFEAGLASGDAFHVGAAAAAMVSRAWIRGVSSRELLALCERLEPVLEARSLREPLETVISVRELVRGLQTGDVERAVSGPCAAELARYRSRAQAHFQLVARAFAALYVGEDWRASALLQEASFLSPLRGTIGVLEHRWVSALVRTREVERLPPLRRLAALASLAATASGLRARSGENPEGFEGKWLLLWAEITMLLGRKTAALDAIERAQRAAESSGHLAVSAMAAARAARWQRAAGGRTLAREHERAAHRAHARWLSEQAPEDGVVGYIGPSQ